MLIRWNEVDNQIAQRLCDLVVYLRKDARFGPSPQRVMPVPHMFLFAQFCQRAIHFVTRNRATLDINQTIRIALKKTDHIILCVHGDAVAIGVVPRRWDDRTHGNVFHFADSSERIPHLSPFNGKLMLVIDVLIGAAAASAEIWALWRDAMRRTLLNFDQLCFRKLLLFPHDFGRNYLVLNGVSNKNGFAMFASDTLSAKRDIFNLQITEAHVINTLL